MLTAGPVRIDLRDRSVSVDQRPVELSAAEYRLLCHVAGEPTRVFTLEELLRDVWGHAHRGRTCTLDSHVISSTISGVVLCWVWVLSGS
jgi:DNA-binding response OmpR family regulator